MGGKVWIADAQDIRKTAQVRGRRLGVETEQNAVYADSSGPFIRFADTVGDGSGTKNANGDYSGAPEEFFITPPSGQIYQIHRLILTIRDTGIFRADRYGALAAALTNGILVQKKSAAGVLDDYTDGVPIQTNVDWSRSTYDVAYYDFSAGDNFLSCRWTFRHSGRPVQLRSGERLAVVLNDNLTGLVQHFFSLQGHAVT